MMPDMTPDAAGVGDATPGPASQPLPLPERSAQPLQNPPAPITPPQPPNPAATAQVAQTLRHSLLGRMADSLLHGGTVDYTPDLKTGEIKPTFRPDKPGDIFRRVVAGMLLGAASGSAPGKDTDFATGFARGGAAVVEQNEALDQQRFARAQQNFQNAQAVQKTNTAEQRIENERIRNQALAESWNVRQLQLEATANHRAGELLAAENRLNEKKLEADRRFGGKMASIAGNGDVGNGKDMQRLFTQHPEMFAPPVGFTRSIIKSYDLADLHYDYTKQGWEDADGNPASVEDHTTWSIMFVPVNGTRQVYTFGELKKTFPDIYGSDTTDPKKEFYLTPDQYNGLAEKQASLAHERWLDNFKQTHEQIANTLAQGRNRLANLHAQYQAAVRNGDDQTAARIQSEIDALNDNIEAAVNAADPHIRPALRDVMAPHLEEAPQNATPAPAAPAAPAPARQPFIKPPKPGAPLSQTDAQKYLARAGGDKNKARQMAQADGWSLGQ